MAGGRCGQRFAPAASARTPPSQPGLSDSAYLLLGAFVFVVALALQYGLYARLLHRPLQTGNLEVARPAVTRWIKTALVYQTVVLVAAGGYVVVVSSGHPRGFAWVAPPLAAVIGTAIPLQVAVATILRATRRL